MTRFVLTAVFVALFSVAALAGPPSLVMVNCYYKKILVTRGPGQTETIETLANELPKNREAIAEQLHSLFTKLYAEGYTLQSSISPSSFLFVKP